MKHNYDYTKSSTKIVSPGQTPYDYEVQTAFANEVVTGLDILDRICFGTTGSSSCAYNYPFFGITASQSSTSFKVAGLLGLAPTAGEYNFVQTLFEQKKISKKMFAFKQGPLDSSTSTSSFMVGGYDRTQIAKPVQHHIGDDEYIVWQRTHSADSWALPLSDFMLGSNSIIDDDYKVIIDIGKTQSFLPKSLYDAFKAELLSFRKDVSCSAGFCIYQADANDSCVKKEMKDIQV